MASKKLKQAATAENISYVPSSLDDKHHQMIDKLEGRAGADFTKQYVQMQLQAHENAVMLFENCNNLGKFAAKTLPTLQEHLEIVKMLSEQA